MRLSSLVGLALLCVAGAVCAEPIVKVARASVDLGGGEWVELHRAERVIAELEQMRGVIRADEVTLALVEHGRVRALVLISATPSGRGPRIDWGSPCERSTEQRWSTPLRGGHPEDRECADATVAYRAEAALGDAPALREAMHGRKLQLPEAFVAVSASVSTRFGWVMSVTLQAEPGFLGLTDAAPTPLPPRVKPAHAAYAVLLGTRIRDCLFSIRQNLALPSIAFAAEPRIVSTAH